MMTSIVPGDIPPIYIYLYIIILFFILNFDIFWFTPGATDSRTRT